MRRSSTNGLLSALAAIVSILGMLTPSANAECECGYYVPETSSLFTHAQISDFTETERIKTVADMKERLTDWTIQSWTSPGTDESLFGTENFRLPRINMEQNVWLEEGSLHLLEKAYSEEDYKRRISVQVAEVVAEEQEVLYGSFRAEFRVLVEEETKGGACAGFFYYFVRPPPAPASWMRAQRNADLLQDDKSEIDIEIITSDDTHSVHYTKHLGANSSTSKDFLREPFTSFQEHRFDWSPHALYFYQNGERVKTLGGKIPDKPGHIHINLWADDSEWTGRPADRDVRMEVRRVALYYNTSRSHAGRDEEWEEGCRKAKERGEGKVCRLEEGVDELLYNVIEVGSGAGGMPIGWMGVVLAAVAGWVVL